MSQVNSHSFENITLLLNNTDYFKITKSSSEYDSTQQPFFLNDNNIDNSNNNLYINSNNNIKLKIDEILNLNNLNNLNNIVKEFYYYYENTDQELYINNWTFLSLNKILDLYKEYQKDQIYIIDIAFTYIGMGWVKILSYDSQKNIFFIRRDGGSNCYDRDDNYNSLKEYCKNNNNENIIIQKFESFYEFINTIKNDNN